MKNSNSNSNNILLIIILGSIAAIGPFTIDMYLPAFSTIAQSLGIKENVMSYTITSYFIGIAIGQLMYGPIIDKFGRKKPLIIGLTIYVIASLAIALTPNIYYMIGMRFVQALGASVGMVASMAIVRDIFKGSDIAKMLSNIVLVMGVAPAIAPTLGSLFLDWFPWQAIFLFLFSFALLVLIGTHFFLKETTGYNANMVFNPQKIALDYWNMLHNKAFMKFTISGSVAMSLLFCYIVAIPFLLMNIYGVDKSTFGWMFGLNAIGLVIGSQVNRVLLKRISLIKLTNNVYIIAVVMCLAMFALSSLVQIPLVFFASFTFTLLFFIGFLNPNAMALAMDNVNHNIGSASAINGSMRMAFGAIVSALFGYFYKGSIQTFFIFLVVLSIISLLLHFWALKDAKGKRKAIA